MRALIICHPTPKDIRSVIHLLDDDYVVAVDQAVLDLYKQRIKIDLAIGDFDSLKNHGVLTNLNVIKLAPEKDVTDTYQALLEANKMGPDEVIIIGGIGGDRIEHFMVHLMHFDAFNNLRIIDEHSEIFMLENQDLKVSFKGYVSIFAYPDAVVNLVGFKYPLNNYPLTQFDPLGISNEVTGDATISVKKGRVLVVLSKKDR